MSPMYIHCCLLRRFIRVYVTSVGAFAFIAGHLLGPPFSHTTNRTDPEMARPHSTASMMFRPACPVKNPMNRWLF